MLGQVAMNEKRVQEEVEQRGISLYTDMYKR